IIFLVSVFLFKCKASFCSKLANFKPDAIVIEHPLGGQQKVDSLFKAYLAGNHKLSKSEVQQLGFRIAKMCKAKI
ncbi:DUF5694 domain-containing protein, partial [Bacteroides uniformis]|uniref:DUF5694 domain-containing protein n=1 Tax=Bacteroides uniformis TaxID=820 RepID=UPI001D05CD0A